MKLSDTGLTVLRDGEFDDLGLLPNGPRVLGFLKGSHLADAVGGPVVTDVLIPTPFTLDGTWGRAFLDADAPQPGPYPQGAVWSKEPEETFWLLHERLVADGFYPKRENEIGQNTRIHPTAVIGDWDRGLHRGHGTVTNAGYVRIGDRVTIGAQSCVDRSVWKAPTRIGDDSHIDNLVHVAHNVQIGKRCVIIAGTVIGGSAVIGDDVFIGIGARIRPGVRIGDGAFIGMSVTVLEDVPAGARLTCRSS